MYLLGLKEEYKVIRKKEAEEDTGREKKKRGRVAIIKVKSQNQTYYLVSSRPRAMLYSQGPNMKPNKVNIQGHIKL